MPRGTVVPDSFNEGHDQPDMTIRMQQQFKVQGDLSQKIMLLSNSTTWSFTYASASEVGPAASTVTLVSDDDCQSDSDSGYCPSDICKDVKDQDKSVNSPAMDADDSSSVDDSDSGGVPLQPADTVDETLEPLDLSIATESDPPVSITEDNLPPPAPTPPPAAELPLPATADMEHNGDGDANAEATNSKNKYEEKSSSEQVAHQTEIPTPGKLPTASDYQINEDVQSSLPARSIYNGPVGRHMDHRRRPRRASRGIANHPQPRRGWDEESAKRERRRQPAKKPKEVWTKPVYDRNGQMAKIKSRETRSWQVISTTDVKGGKNKRKTKSWAKRFFEHIAAHS